MLLCWLRSEDRRSPLEESSGNVKRESDRRIPGGARETPRIEVWVAFSLLTAPGWGLCQALRPIFSRHRGAVAGEAPLRPPRITLLNRMIEVFCCFLCCVILVREREGKEN